MSFVLDEYFIFFCSKSKKQRGRHLLPPLVTRLIDSADQKMVHQALFEATDCACSALACNCLQLSCGCVPTTATTKTNNFATTARWMQRLGDIDPTIPFRDLILIGTHNAASSSIHNFRPGSAVAQCQRLDIGAQLRAGVRMLDVRLATSRTMPSRLAIWHGAVSGGDLVETAIQPLCDYIDQHKHEVVVLQLTPEFGRPFDVPDKQRALALVHKFLGVARILHGRHLSDLLQSWTLGDLRRGQTEDHNDCASNNKRIGRVLVLVHPRFFVKPNSRRFNASTVLEDFGFAPQDKWLRSLWFNTRHPETLLSYSLEEVTRQGRQKRHFHGSQLVLTPGVGSLLDVLAACIGVNSLRPASLAHALYRRLGRYLRLHVDEPWNWVLLDYVDQGIHIVHFLTALNFPVTFQLHLAMLEVISPGATTSRDVTAQIAPCVCRKRVLFVESIHNVLGLSSDTIGTLTIVYQLGEQHQVVVQPFEKVHRGESTLLLLSGFGHSCDKDLVTTLPPNQNHGYVYNGSVLPSSTPLSIPTQGNVLEFTSSERGFSCSAASL